MMPIPAATMNTAKIVRIAGIKIDKIKYTRHKKINSILVWITKRNVAINR